MAPPFDIYSEKGAKILPGNMLFPPDALMPREKRIGSPDRRGSRRSGDAPSTEDGSDLPCDSMHQDFDIDTSSDESVWSM